MRSEGTAAPCPHIARHIGGQPCPYIARRIARACFYGARLAEYRSALISAAVTGKIDVREAQ